MDVPVKGRMWRVEVVSGHLPTCVFTGMTPKRLLVVFDFDWYFLKLQPWMPPVLIVSVRSMADQDTDRYIFEVNAIDLRRKIRNLQTTVQWTDLV
jgi:pyridoxal phosphate phosphatase PHOSPHO2